VCIVRPLHITLGGAFHSVIGRLAPRGSIADAGGVINSDLYGFRCGVIGASSESERLRRPPRLFSVLQWTAGHPLSAATSMAVGGGLRKPNFCCCSMLGLPIAFGSLS
jgi:hypothetical protein